MQVAHAVEKAIFAFGVIVGLIIHFRDRARCRKAKEDFANFPQCGKDE
jgi:hypothetical protein